MSENEKRCGTCRWWDYRYVTRGRCLAEPPSPYRMTDKPYTDECDGTNCPAHAPRGEAEAKT